MAVERTGCVLRHRPGVLFFVVYGEGVAAR